MVKGKTMDDLLFLLCLVAFISALVLKAMDNLFFFPCLFFLISAFISKAMDSLILFLFLIYILIVFLGHYLLLDVRSDLKPKRGTSPNSGSYIFYFGGFIPPTNKQITFINTYYGKNSLIIDNDSLYRITCSRRRSKEETENRHIGRVVLEVEQLSNNDIYTVYLDTYGRFIYILEHDKFFIDLFGYEHDMNLFLTSLSEEEAFIEHALKKLLHGFPILIEDAIDIGSVVSSHFCNQNAKKTNLLLFWQNICTALHKLDKTGYMNTDYRPKQILVDTDEVIKIMMSVLAEMTERSALLQKRGEVELTGDFQNGLSHLLNAVYGIQISREYTLGRSKKNLGETDLFFYQFINGKKRQLYILENKELSNFKKQYYQLMGYLNPYFSAGITLSINREKGWEEATNYIYNRLVEIKNTDENFAPLLIEKVNSDNGTTHFIKTIHVVPETGSMMNVYHLVLQLSDDARHKAANSARP